MSVEQLTLDDIAVDEGPEDWAEWFAWLPRTPHDPPDPKRPCVNPLTPRPPDTSRKAA